MLASLFPPHVGAPPLPRIDELGTMLVLNPRPAMPIHLCLSVLRTAPRNQRVLVITSSRYSWRDALVQLNDQWLTDRAGDAIVSHLLSRIDVFHAPSRQHYEALLALLRPLTHTDHDRNTPHILRSPPALVVICEPTHYLLDDPESSLADCVSLVTNALASLRFIAVTCQSAARSKLVICDSNLQDLRLWTIGQNQIEPEDVRDGKEPQVEPVLGVIQRYCDSTVTIKRLEEAATSADQGEIEQLVRYKMTVEPIVGGERTESIFVERSAPSHIPNVAPRTVISFPI